VLVVSSSKLTPFKLTPFKLTPLIPLSNSRIAQDRKYVCLREGEILRVPMESGLSLTLPSPAINIYELLPMLPAGEGFTLKVLPEGTGVRLSHTN